ncbi:dihydrofolate reductase family protein [Nocardiopsis trehalosi]|jgi:dihydrofolate reductase|uniref:dihydrofolate reductase family protein n=1 Tax=Nocardiopsis trehalosi TaxID=109329 RepID=UPI00082AFE01|nr:dihydrofolate reductase family protein [Nocardiopsis trehalosi]
MRKIIVSTYSTLDGYIDDPQDWSMSYTAEEAQKYSLDLTLSCGAMLLGRVTYEAMAQAWPHMGGNPFGDHVNSLPKYVVASQPVDTSAWGPATVIAGDELVERVTELKAAEGGDILIWGNGRLTDALAAAGLLDEYRVWLIPVVKGGGSETLFRPESKATLELLDTTVFATGAVVHTYRPENAARK